MLAASEKEGERIHAKRHRVMAVHKKSVDLSSG